jgi:hypothetical protein
VLAAVGGAVVLLLVIIWWGGGEEGEETGFAGGAGAAGLVSVQEAAASQPPPPTELAPDVERALATFAERMDAAVDSLRITRGIGGAPPPQWLSGQYLADADQYPEVRTFWTEYEAVVRELVLLDRPIFLAVVNESTARLADRPADASRARDYLEDRFAGMAPSRGGRVQQLLEAAAHAVALHDFLVSSSADLRYTPALGSAVPRDPVMEVGTDNEAVLESLNAHLDRLFDALDRSRGGGALSQGGLRADLFLGFGVL